MCGAITQKQSVTTHSDFMVLFLYSLYFNRFATSEHSRVASFEFTRVFFQHKDKFVILNVVLWPIYQLLLTV